jgi:hypothetical protein
VHGIGDFRGIAKFKQDPKTTADCRLFLLRQLSIRGARPPFSLMWAILTTSDVFFNGHTMHNNRSRPGGSCFPSRHTNHPWLLRCHFSVCNLREIDCYFASLLRKTSTFDDLAKQHPQELGPSSTDFLRQAGKARPILS